MVTPTHTPPPTQVLLSFEPAAYRDEANNLTLDYPAGWSVEPNMQIGSRGSQAQLLSPGTTAEALAPGGSRLSITIYDWEPKNDLAAFVTGRRKAWEAGQSIILEESGGDLRDGRKAFEFILQGPDGTPAFFLFTTLGERYLQLAGEGDLALDQEVARTFRPLAAQP
jgi:hypothetical protein